MLVAREEIETGDGPVEIRRVLRYRVAGDRFTGCWLSNDLLRISRHPHRCTPCR